MPVPPRRSHRRKSRQTLPWDKSLSEEDIFAAEEKTLHKKRPPGLKVLIVILGVVIAVLLVIGLLSFFDFLAHLPSYDNKDLDKNL